MPVTFPIRTRQEFENSIIEGIEAADVASEDAGTLVRGDASTYDASDLPFFVSVVQDVGTFLPTYEGSTVESMTYAVFIHAQTRGKMMEVLDDVIDCFVEAPTFVPAIVREGFDPSGLRVVQLNITVT